MASREGCSCSGRTVAPTQPRPAADSHTHVRTHARPPLRQLLPAYLTHVSLLRRAHDMAARRGSHAPAATARGDNAGGTRAQPRRSGALRRWRRRGTPHRVPGNAVSPALACRGSMAGRACLWKDWNPNFQGRAGPRPARHTSTDWPAPAKPRSR
eukprot:gene13073-biopygen1965